MTDQETASLRKELEQFQKEKEKIRNLVGQIGGAASDKRDKAINIFFIILLISLLSTDLIGHIFDIEMPIPPILSLELGILLVSIKIIWMIHKQAKIEHFQFWILNSIEFRLNEVSKKLKRIEENMKESAADKLNQVDIERKK